MLLAEVVDEFGSPDDFIGHPGGDNFIVITSEANGDKIQQILKERFADQVLSHYNFIDREQGHVLITRDNGEEEKTPLMSLSVGAISSSQHSFADIREITEMASEARRRDAMTI